ncbi:hypothetical protein BVY01_04425 [bacterium I07]|nr:hypothetical protein BVY01_04425 [bacterium I07]
MSYQSMNNYLHQDTNIWNCPYPVSVFSNPDSRYSVLEMKPNTYWSEGANESEQSIHPVKKTIEKLINHLVGDSPTNPINCIWHDKLTIARFKISSLVHALYLREKLKSDNLYRIDQDICNIHTQQFALQDAHFGQYSMNSAQFGLEKAVTGLESEKRSEAVGCWKDILGLRKDLTDAITEYLSIKRKTSLLGMDSNIKIK